MGQAWIDPTDEKTGKVGLGNDVAAVAEVRRGLRDAQYAMWHANVQAGRRAPETAHLEVLRAARHVGRRVRSGSARAKACERRTPPPMARPPRNDSLGCPKVAPGSFKAECLLKGRPCILRGQAAAFLRRREGGLGSLDRWLDVAANATVSVAFPFPATHPDGMPTLNSIQETAKFLAQDDVRLDLERMGLPAADAEEFPWTLVRPATWAMRLQDAVAWVRTDPQEVYMNQAMVADLGSAAVGELREPRWVAKAGLRLLSPSLWLSSGAVTTGFHTDGPDNLLVQLSGRKDVLLSRPSEQKNLYYLPAFDVQAGMRLENGTVRSSGVRKANRTSSGIARSPLLPLCARPRWSAARLPRLHYLSMPGLEIS
ncbi:unnamed protein product [Prorocentrum cordatum]|uniref:Cupin-like domain-containing protein n=1 Tax=Prorocentrum cordatum TaxID=2364126 RepID=A0ABN9QSP2_9DINO|nr:unnamed protein product [Polarella glacialis]